MESPKYINELGEEIYILSSAIEQKNFQHMNSLNII